MGSTVKIGYLLPTRDQAVLGAHDMTAFVDLARCAERCGFDSVWAGDSPVTRPRADPLMVLAAVAQATTRPTLGTAVLLPALRHPILLAHQLATLDRLSEGRLIAGMGIGFPTPGTRAQYAAMGIDFRTRADRLAETIDILRHLWSSTEVTHEGAHFAFQDVRLLPPPTRPAGPPIWLAGSGGPALRRVAHLADGWLPYPVTAGDYTSEYKIIEHTATRPVLPALYATLCIDDDPELARQRLRHSIERYYRAPLEAIASLQALFSGTPAAAAAWLNDYLSAGAQHLVIRLVADDPGTELTEFADRVMPLLPRRTRA
ncbi:LLM class flavin-dependent oxidoreductase [Nocardia puris]|uniref:LLM class flavin-dependent oxidoreductase n=1 Tax=Nocardia puris TaxID=208602 RepID=UPI001894B63C|nr:LLM class flavin-dependent oxidoreductase [Nocardia puris]MBF6210382.1 LLM class flavin-dependent oxidoreductase [Nocardia puris]MBF6367457.1 LLM class flavin-dependent oxidoreductase [Nocardia puris]MBF6457642.1 LLM class flavin-dependent oxidoreductase [Nocardia puris]